MNDTKLMFGHEIYSKANGLKVFEVERSQRESAAKWLLQESKERGMSCTGTARG